MLDISVPVSADIVSAPRPVTARDSNHILQFLSELSGAQRATALAEHFRTDFHRLMFAGQEDWLEKLSAGLDLDAREILNQARESLGTADLSGWKLDDLFDYAMNLGCNAEKRGSLMVRWLDTNGGKRFVDSQQRLILVKAGRDVVVGSNVRFDGFLLREAGMTTRTQNVGRVIAAFRAAAINGARRIRQLSWLHTDHANHAVYLHLNAAEHQIVRVAAKGLDLLDNGSNEAAVLLTPSTTTQRWNLQSLSQGDYEEALRSLDELVLSRMACSRENQLLIGCWTLAFPLTDYARTHPHLRAEGSTGLGKTAGIDLISTLIYGAPEKVVATTAFNYSESSVNPFLFWDNLEKSAMAPTLEQFLLLAVTGGKRGKRVPGTTSATVREEIRCLTCSTGIENLGRGELINRTIHIVFDKNKFGNRPIIASDLEQIKTQRSRLLSAHMHLVQRVLKRVSDGEMIAWQDRLDTKHFLARANDFIALMALIAEELLPVIEPQLSVAELVQSWIADQDQYGRQTTREASQIVTLVEALATELDVYNSGISRARWAFDVHILPNGQLSGLSREWHLTFAGLKSKKHVRYDIIDAGQLTRRMKDAQSALLSAGFVLQWDDDKHHKVTRFTVARADGTAAATPAVESTVAA